MNTSHTAHEVEETFDIDSDLVGVIIIDKDTGRLAGMISRKRFMELYSKPFRKELYTKKTLSLLIKNDFDKPLCLKETDSVDYAVRMALSRSIDQIYEPVAVLTEQCHLKLIDTHVLLLELAKVYEHQSLELQNTLFQVKQLNADLEESRESILQSLHYAGVIQKSILPQNELFARLFCEWFTIYRPRDIVGGDIYWLREINGHLLLAVIDCTGHGVPGAFMTMTVNAVLNHVVDMLCFDDPGRILAEMNRMLQKTLHLRGNNNSIVDAGLDMILCCINTRQNTLTFAGAGLSLYLFAHDQLREIKGGRAGIGYSGSSLDYKYPNHVLNVGEGDIFYAPTDGFLDENGGAEGFGLGRERFKTMVKQHAHHPLEHQREFLELTLAQWRGTRSQRDDITMVGFRL